MGTARCWCGGEVIVGENGGGPLICGENIWHAPMSLAVGLGVEDES